jgi:hypothetical protein
VGAEQDDAVRTGPAGTFAQSERTTTMSTSENARNPVDTALAEFDAALAAIPVADADQRSGQIQVLRSSRGGWLGTGVVVGTVEQVRAVLRANLDRDTGRADSAGIVVLTFAEQGHVQLQLLTPVQGPVNFTRGGGVYRVWRTDEGAALYGRSPEILTAGAAVEALS